MRIGELLEWRHISLRFIILCGMAIIFGLCMELIEKVKIYKPQTQGR